MKWDANHYGSHAETALRVPSTTWYFAEGATHSGFDLFYLVQNPNAQPVDVEVRYLLPSPALPLTKNYTVPARSRFNIWVDLEPGLENTDVSAVITASQSVIAERAMYLTGAGPTFGAGHESAGTFPALSWFFAEGATGRYLDLFILLANPSNTTAQVTARYLLPSGQTIDKSRPG